MKQNALFPDDPGSGSEPSGKNVRQSRTNRARAAIPQSGPETSRKSADEIVPAAMAQAARVFEYLSRCGDDGATDHEIQAELGLSGDSERPRRWSLQRSGLIRDSGKRRKSPTGRDAIVWIAVTDRPSGNRTQAS